MNNRLDTKTIIGKFRKKHRDTYDYTKVNFVGSHTKVIITCPSHGDFLQTPAIHLRGSGCPKCGRTKIGKNKRIDTDEWVKRAIKVHGEKYDYSNTTYHTSRTKLVIVCPTHGPFEILPSNHLKGVGCRVCGLSSNKQLTNFDPTKEFKSVHGDRYDYSEFKYTGSNQLGKIVCPSHGPFMQSYSTHIKGHGCNMCGQRSVADQTYTQADIIERFKFTHGDYYDYSLARFRHINDAITIICPEHGEFDQLPKSHIRGSGCPKCHRPVTQAETRIGDFVESLGIEVLRDTKLLIPPHSVSIYAPSAKLAIEYCGLYWHGEKSGNDNHTHHHKMLALNQIGIDLITIFEDEWLDRPDVVKSILTNRIGSSKTGIGGRHLRIVQIKPQTSRDFLNLHHIQGAARGTVHLGAYHDDELVGVMVFGRPTRQTSSYEWELTRAASDGRTHAGMMGKLFAHFRNQWRPESVVSFSDMRWFSGGSYHTMGFVKDGVLKPDYFYHKNGKRYLKSMFRKSGIQRHHPEVYHSEKTEREMMHEAGYDRIWDCGKIRWVWTETT